MIAFGLILGFFTREQAFRKLGKVLILSSLIPVFISMSKNYLSELPLVQKLIFIGVIGFISLFVLLRVLFGKNFFNCMAGNFLYESVKGG